MRAKKFNFIFLWISTVILFFLVSCSTPGTVKIRPEKEIKCDPVITEVNSIFTPYLPIERARSCIKVDSINSIYDSITNNIVLQFQLKSEKGSYYFGGSKLKNRKIWCEVHDSVNGIDYNIKDFTVNESISDVKQNMAIALVLDHSGSMGNRAALLQESVLEMIKNKRIDDALCVIKFDHRVTTEVPFLRDQKELLSRFKLTGLDGFGGMTAMNDACDAGIKLLESIDGYDNKVVFLFTDGFENCSKTPQQSVIDAAVKKHIKIHIINFGGNTDEGYIQRMVSQTSGKSHRIDQSIQILGIFDEIYGDLTMGPLTYDIVFKPVEPLGRHYPKIKLCTDNCLTIKEFKPIGFNQEAVMLNINFARGEAVITGDESFKQIESVAKYLKDNPNVRIRLEGHTDCIGSREFNLKLSNDRAEVVRKKLTSDKISVDRIEIKGYGFDQPHKITPEDLKTYNLLQRTMLIGTELKCDYVNNIPNKEVQEILHLLNRRTKMVILK